MSYFLLATGRVPHIDDIPNLQFVPAKKTQRYVADIVAAAVDARDHDETYLLDDGTMTTDAVVAEASDQMAEGTAFEATRLGQVILRLLDVGCTVRVWWPSPAGGLPVLDTLDHPVRFVEQLTERMRSGADLNSAYEPRS